MSREMFFGTGGTFALSPRQAAARRRARMASLVVMLPDADRRAGRWFSSFFELLAPVRCGLLRCPLVFVFVFLFFFFKGEDG